MNNRNRRGEAFVLNEMDKSVRIVALWLSFALYLGVGSGLAQERVTQPRVSTFPANSGQKARPALAAEQTANLTAEELYKSVLPSIMTVLVDKSSGPTEGTAFLISKEGLALTAWHLVKDGRRAVAKFSDGEEFEVSGLVDKDERRDLALIRVKVFGRPPLVLEGTEPAVGSKAYIVGAPKGLEFSISDGLISQIHTMDGVKQFQFTCPASPGNSGGPLINEKAQVIGVVAWQLRDGQNLNFAVPLSYALGLDTSLPTQPFDSVKPADSFPSVTDSASLGLTFVQAFASKHDTLAALMVDFDRVVVAPNGYRSGVGRDVYASQTILQEHLQKLESISSSDSTTEALRNDLAKVLRAQLQAIDLYIRAVREAGMVGGWSPDAKDLISRSTGAKVATDSLTNQIWKTLQAKYLSFIPPGLSVMLKDNPNSSTWFNLGVSTWSGDSLVLNHVHRGGLAEAFGFRAGDRILLAGDRSPKNMIEVKEEIMRAAGSKLTIRVRRSGADQDLEVKVPKQLNGAH
jgi:S1-C subfamily serine protease